MSDQTILEVKDLKKYFSIGKKQLVHAVDGVSFRLDRGKTLGLVGESGCGKSTCARTIIRMYDVTGGSIVLDGTDITNMNQKELKPLRRKMQMIFQDPYASLNARMTVRDIIAEPLIAHNVVKNKAESTDLVYAMLDQVGLTKEHANRYAHEFSGGQRQRVGIARALILQPELVICDEPISALDVSIQAQILNLMQDLQEQMGLTYIFITHDLSVVKYISDNILVMYLGNMVEYASTKELFKNPVHPYTKALLSAVPTVDIDAPKKKILLEGEIFSPINPKPGCRFASRCRYATEKCRAEQPELKDIGGGHVVACHNIDSIKP